MRGQVRTIAAHSHMSAGPARLSAGAYRMRMPAGARASMLPFVLRRVNLTRKR